MSYPLGILQEPEYMMQPSSSNGNKQFDMKKIMYKVAVMLPWVIICVIISYIAALLYLRYTPSKHQVLANILIVKKEEEANLDYVVLKELGVAQPFNDVFNQMDILKASTLLERVVDSLQLNIHIRQEGRVTKQQIYGDEIPFQLNVLETNAKASKNSLYKLNLDRDGFELNGKGIKRSYKYGDTAEVEYGIISLERNPAVKINPGGYTVEFGDRHDEANSLKDRIGVALTNDKGGGIIEISMMDEIPERAIEILNKLIEVFNTVDLEDKSRVTKKTIKFLNDRIDSVSYELNKIEAAAEQYKSKNRITDIAIQGGSYQNQALTVDDQKIKQIGILKNLDALDFYVRNFKSTNDIIPSSMNIGETSLQKLVIQHNDLVFEKQMLEQKSSPLDPGLKRLNQDIINIRENLLRNISILKKSYEIAAKDLEINYNNLEDRISELPKNEREILRLKRMASVKEELYKYLLQKEEEAQLLLASNINDTRVIDYANDFGAKTPNKSLIKMLAVIIGIIVPVIIMIIKDFLNNKITDKQEIENTTQVPIVGELSYLKRRKGVVVDTQSKNPIAEQFRLLRTNLHYIAPGGQKFKTILLSSFISGEGKSFVSLNLANSLNATGAKTIILEFDLRNPRLSKMLKIINDVGLSNFISGELAVEDIIKTVPELNNTSIITSGAIPSNPAELLLSNKTTELFEFLKLHYDYIIIDSAPVGLVTDALLLEKYADITLFIIRHRFTLKAILPYIDKLNTDKKFKNMGIVVNGIKKDGSYGYSFGFGYSYSYYLSEKRKSLIHHILPFLGKTDV
jgi:capsular exopolysaccharide synthesis family protein